MPVWPDYCSYYRALNTCGNMWIKKLDRFAGCLGRALRITSVPSFNKCTTRRNRLLPLPKPKSNEQKRHFMSRCMSNATMRREYPDQSKRAAVCNSAWDRKHSLFIMWMQMRGFTPCQIAAAIAHINNGGM